MGGSAGVLGYLASVGVRSLVLFGAAAVVLAAFRVKAAAARHAVWTVVAIGMLLLAALTPALPGLPLRLLKPAPVAVAPLPNVPFPDAAASTAPAPVPAPAARRWTWQDASLAAYAAIALLLLGRLAIGYLFTRRLLRAAAPVDRFDNTYQSNWISVPMTVGRIIVLPAEWETWDEPKLAAVMAHERTHVRRADWAIALASGVNRCVFWFHPLAWWLDRHLATLAEEACDDSALLLVESRPYAQALLEMAAAVKTAQGRLIWEAMAMAKAAEVRKRIERILDETRQIPRGLTRARWVALVACSVPLVWIASVAQLVSAAPQDGPKTPAAMSEFLKGRRQLTQADVNIMEQYLRTNPQDIDVRTQLVLYYYSIGVREPRTSHIVWVVANYPGSSAAGFLSSGVAPREGADFDRVAGAWKQAIAAHANDLQVLQNGAQFYLAAGDLDEAERLLKQALAVQPSNLAVKDRLAKLYALAILESTGDPKYPATQPAFSSRVRSEILNSEDGNLMFATGAALNAAVARPVPGRPLRDGALNADEHPLLQPAVELGQKLMERAGQFGGPRVVIMQPPAGGVSKGVLGGIIGSAPSTGVAGGTPGGVLGGIIGSAPSTPRPQLANQPTPPIVKRVEPEYPPLARQARISGVVKFVVTIAADGSVANLEVQSGHPLLVPAALQAVKNWTFQPTGSEIRTTLDVPFTLPPGDAPAAAATATTLQAAGAPMEQYGAFGKAGKIGMLRVPANAQAGMLVEKVEPVYPPQARADGIEGDVTLKITIGEDGQVAEVEPVDGNPALALAAQDAVRQWRYQPTLARGNPVKVQTTVTVQFRLR
jgi:TonB family protein